MDAGHAAASRVAGRDEGSVRELNLDTVRLTSVAGLSPKLAALRSLSLNNTGLTSLEGLPHLPSLRKLYAADNNIAGGLDCLVRANLVNLTVLDLSNNHIATFDQLRPLKQLPNLRHLDLLQCDVCKTQGFREKTFTLIPSLVTLNGMDKHGTEIEEDDDEDDDEDNDEGEDDEGEDDAPAEQEDDEGEDDEGGVAANGGVDDGEGDGEADDDNNDDDGDEAAEGRFTSEGESAAGLSSDAIEPGDNGDEEMQEEYLPESDEAFADSASEGYMPGLQNTSFSLQMQGNGGSEPEQLFMGEPDALTAYDSTSLSDERYYQIHGSGQKRKLDQTDIDAAAAAAASSGQDDRATRVKTAEAADSTDALLDLNDVYDA